MCILASGFVKERRTCCTQDTGRGKGERRLVKRSCVVTESCGQHACVNAVFQHFLQSRCRPLYDLACGDPVDNMLLELADRRWLSFWSHACTSKSAVGSTGNTATCSVKLASIAHVASACCSVVITIEISPSPKSRMKLSQRTTLSTQYWPLWRGFRRHICCDCKTQRLFGWTLRQTLCQKRMRIIVF